MAIKNDTNRSITVSIKPWRSDGEHSSCIDLADGTTFGTGYHIEPNKTYYIAFWRSGLCHGKQGWLGIQAYGASLPKQSPSDNDFQQFWFSADGDFSKHGRNSAYQNSLETFRRTIGPTVPLVLHIQPMSAVTPERAEQDGCSSKAKLMAMLSKQLQSTSLGYITEEKMEGLVNTVSDNSTTSSIVTDPNVRVYRAATIIGETDYLLHESALLTKFDRRISELSEDEKADFIASNGPLLDDSSPVELIQSLQMLATQSTDVPAAQTASLALRYETAKIFQQKTLFAFRLNPNSPILGLKNCARGSGEDQFQARGDTIIHDLYKIDVGSSQWQKFIPSTGSWFLSSPPAP